MVQISIVIISKFDRIAQYIFVDANISSSRTYDNAAVANELAMTLRNPYDTIKSGLSFS